MTLQLIVSRFQKTPYCSAAGVFFMMNISLRFYLNAESQGRNLAESADASSGENTSKPN